jgi:hypothetical protein
MLHKLGVVRALLHQILDVKTVETRRADDVHENPGFSGLARSFVSLNQLLTGVPLLLQPRYVLFPCLIVSPYSYAQMKPPKRRVELIFGPK